MDNQPNFNNKINRREFVNYTGSLMAMGMAGLSLDADRKRNISDREIVL